MRRKGELSPAEVDRVGQNLTPLERMSSWAERQLFAKVVDELVALALASGPIPKFVNARGMLWYELRNLRTTSNSMNLVRLLNLRFLNELAATNDRNLKFAALVPPI